MKRRAVFLDLNGTLVLPLKQESLEEMTLIPDADRAVARLTAAGFLCPVVTVQARIAKGLFTRDEFEGWFRGFSERMAASGAILLGPYVCPHRYNERCACEKPNTLLYDRAGAEHGIDLTRSFVIGDSRQDVEAAQRFGGNGVLVTTGWAVEIPDLVDAASPYASFVVDGMEAAVDWILAADEEP